jgi:hypothetical protein
VQMGVQCFYLLVLLVHCDISFLAYLMEFLFCFILFFVFILFFIFILYVFH